MADPQQLFRRRLRLTNRTGIATGEVADDAHHFRVCVRHDGKRVLEVTGEAVRFPWTTCPAAATHLEALHGMPLDRRSTAIGDHASARANCTHMFDLAGLAVAHAYRGGGMRLYDCAVENDEGGGQCATLNRDGERLLDWRIQDGRIDGAEPFAGVPLLGSSFLVWAESNLEADLAEAAIVLRRVCYVAPVRGIDLDMFERAGDLPAPAGACYTYSEGREQIATRIKGTQRDFSQHPEQMLPPQDGKNETARSK